MKQLHGFIIIAVLVLSLGVYGCDTVGDASAGKIMLVSAGKQYVPLENFVYSCNRDGLCADGMRKQPQEVADELEKIEVSDDVRIAINGRTSSSCYTLYDSQNQMIYDSQEKFVMPEESGRYILRVNVTWGTKKVYEGFEYFFMLDKQ